jgi:hypothetical protein
LYGWFEAERGKFWRVWNFLTSSQNSGELGRVL